MTGATTASPPDKFRHALAIALAVWAVIYLPGLGQPELKGEEGRRILPAVRMLETGDWLVPEMEGRPYVRKPPLVNWAIAASMKMTGRRDEWSARLPSAVSVLVLALVAMSCGRELVAGPRAAPGDSTRAALAVGLMILTSIGLIEKGRTAEIEAMYISLTGLAIILWIHWWRREASAWITWTIPWLILGLGMICKGPPHLIFFYGIVATTLMKARRWRELFHPAHFVGLAIMSAVALPWFILCARRVAETAPDLAVAQTWGQQIFSRLGFDEFDWSGWLETPFLSLLEFAPWIVLIVLAWRRLPALADSIGGRDGAVLAGLRIGSVTTAVLIWLMPSTRARFVLPLTLPIVLLAATILVQAAPEAWRTWWMRIVRVLFVLLTLGGIVAPFFLNPTGAAPGFPLSAAGAALATAVFLGFLWRWMACPRDPVVGVCFGTAALAGLFSIISAWTILPALATLDNCRPVGARISAAIPPGETLVILNSGRTPPPLHWRFHLTGPHTVVDKPRQIPDAAHYLCVEEDALKNDDTMDRLRHQLGFSEDVLPLTYNNGRRLLIIRRPP